MAIQAQFPSCGSQDRMEVGCGGFHQSYFNVQQQRLQQLQLQQQQQLWNMQQLQNQQPQQQQQLWNMQQLDNLDQQSQNPCYDGDLGFSSSLKKNCCTVNPQSMALSQTIVASDDKQRQEIDHYIRIENERFRLLLKEQRRQQLALLLRGVETKALPILRQKDEEIEQATKKSMELEEFLKKLVAENQEWQRLAQVNEAIVISLSNTIEQIRENAASNCFDNHAEDAESSCEVNRETETGDGNRCLADDNINEERKATKTSTPTKLCGGCNSRNSCILFLPCRHLCSCKPCEAFLDFCPVCQTAKKASIEALIV